MLQTELEFLLNDLTFNDPARTPHHDNREVTFVHLKRRVKWPEVRALIRYLGDFGNGRAQAHSRDGGWCLALSSPDDLALLEHQHSELIERHEVVVVAIPDGANDP